MGATVTNPEEMPREVPMDKTQHWENIHRTKDSTEVSWYEASPTQSMALILEAVGTMRGRILDVGGGQSFLVDQLLDAGFSEVAVLDISSEAIAANKKRLGDRTSRVRWIVGDIVHTNFLGQFDVWHDRAVLHFLTDPADRQRYVDLLKRTLPMGGYFVVGTFAKGGAEKCSGLPIQQYDRLSMTELLGTAFEAVQHLDYLHTTPSGKTQLFYFGLFRKIEHLT
jgi:SAM-dependent methyltransferase